MNQSGIQKQVAKDAAAIGAAAKDKAIQAATAAADAAATAAVAKAKAKAWKLRFRGLACVLLTLWAHYFVLLPLLAAHPTFSIVVSVVPYVRTHPRKQRSTTHPTILQPLPTSLPAPPEGKRHLSAPSHHRSHQPQLLARRPSCTPGPSTIS